MLENIQQTTSYIKSRIGDFEPEVGIILGTGLGGLVTEIEVEKQLMYSNIPDFPISTLEFHSGKLIFGMLAGKRVVAMQGRLHYYEGYTMQQITFPVRVMKMLGIKTLFVSNASGSLNHAFAVDCSAVIDRHRVPGSSDKAAETTSTLPSTSKKYYSSAHPLLEAVT